MTEQVLSGMLAQLNQSQQSFLDLLDGANEDSLHKQPADEDWTAAMVLTHMAEARQFFAGEIKRIAAAPGVEVGRSLDDPHRLQTIANHGHESSGVIRQKLNSSYEQLVSILTTITDDDLAVTCEHVTAGTFTLEEIIGRYVVGHDRSHVQQVTELLQS